MPIDPRSVALPPLPQPGPQFLAAILDALPMWALTSQQKELRRSLANSLASAALRLTHANEDWAFQARAQLLGLLPKKPRGHAREILDGLLYVSAVMNSL